LVTIPSTFKPGRIAALAYGLDAHHTDGRTEYLPPSPHRVSTARAITISSRTKSARLFAPASECCSTINSSSFSRLAVLEAARQIDRNEDIRIESELSGQATGATAARDAVSALTDLLQAQNAFMGIWANFEADRRSLDFAMGTLQLTQDGLWIDPGVINAEYGQIDPWLRQDNNFVMPEVTPMREELPPPPAAPQPQGALPGGRPSVLTTGTTPIGNEPDSGAAANAYGGLLPARGLEATYYEPGPAVAPASLPVANHDGAPAAPPRPGATALRTALPRCPKLRSDSAGESDKRRLAGGTLERNSGRDFC
jgi:hypothetical protein